MAPISLLGIPLDANSSHLFGCADGPAAMVEGLLDDRGQLRRPTVPDPAELNTVRGDHILKQKDLLSRAGGEQEVHGVSNGQAELMRGAPWKAAKVAAK